MQFEGLADQMALKDRVLVDDKAMERDGDMATYAPRPKGLKRRALFLDAAMRAFVRDGFEGTSLKAIVAEVGGSLTTLYQMFGNKKGLFQAVIAHKFDSVYGPSETFALKGRPAEEALTDVGAGLLEMILSDDALGLHRLMIAEAAQTPELRESFMALAPNRGRAALAAYFTEEVAAGRLVVKDCDLAATQFLGLVKGDILMRRLLGEDVRLDADARAAIVANAVGLFLRGILPR